MPASEHRVVIVVDGKQIGGWEEYTIETSLLAPASTFSGTLPIGDDSAEVWRTCRPDRRFKVLIDDVVVLSGFLDAPKMNGKAGTITVSGRCKAGRLVQESAPSVNFDGLTLKGLIEKVAAPWFSKVVLSNARNRKVLRGKGQKARSTESVYVDTRVGKRIEPGQMRWTVIQELCEQAGYIAWSSGDGSELVVGQPDYKQEIQYRFVHLKPGSSRQVGEQRVLDARIEPSTADRYSRIIVLGSGAGTSANFGLPVAARAGEVKDNALTANGEGRDFVAQKVLVLADRDVKSRAVAEGMARREAARRNMSAEAVEVDVPYHGQLVDGLRRTLYTIDTLAWFEDEVTETEGTYLVVGVTFRSSRQGETSTLSLVPAGTEIAL